jgi:hypothetical protein
MNGRYTKGGIWDGQPSPNNSAERSCWTGDDKIEMVNVFLKRINESSSCPKIPFGNDRCSKNKKRRKHEKPV